MRNWNAKPRGSLINAECGMQNAELFSNSQCAMRNA